MSTFELADGSALVRAIVQQYAKLSRLIPGQNDRILTHERRNEVTSVRDLAFVPDEKPASREDPFEFYLVNGRVTVDAPIYSSDVWLNERRGRGVVDASFDPNGAITPGYAPSSQRCRG
jgi:hypothetical protein